nr:zinc knuckle CX2CX4HX4C [Tanacetum cinerariifolium]
QIAQPGMNMSQDRQMQMVGGNGGNQFKQYAGNPAGYNDVIGNRVIQNAVQNLRVQNVRNPNGIISVQGNGNQNQIRNGNLVAARAERNAAEQNGNQIRCYNCRGIGLYARSCTARPRRRDAAYLQTQLLIAQKEKAGIQLQAEELKRKMNKKNSGIDEVNSSVNSHGNGDNKENSSDGKKVDDKCNRSIKKGGEERNDRDGFVGNLNGEQFLSISKIARNKNVGRKDNMECLDKESNFGGTGNINNDVGVDTVVIGDESDNNSKDEVNVDMEKSKDNKLISVPTQTSETGNGMVIFDDKIIELGSKKWNLTVCGQFIGCSMGFNEARYHIRRMWSRLGLRDVIANGVFYFKFQDEEGIKKVIKNGPWMVYNKPMVVQKWNINICFDKAKPKKMHIWVKLLNVLMKAWSVKGINALASSLGKPIIMDEVTTKMCVTGVGRISFARVLVETNTRKGIKDKIDIMYQSKNVAEDSYCKFEKINMDNTETMKSNGNEFKVYGRMWREGRYGNENNRNSKFEYRVRDDGIRKKSMNNNNGKYIKANGRNTTNKQASGGNIERKENSMNNGKERNEGSTIGGISPGEGRTRRIVDEFLSKQGNVNNKEMNGWNEDMKRYYRDKKELLDAMRMMEKNKDVMGMNDGEGNDVLRNEVEGKEKLIEEEKLSFCAILETHVKYKNIKKTREKLLGIGNILLMSNGSANPSSEMIDFQECVNNNGIMDLHSKVKIPNGVQKKKRVILDSQILLQIKRNSYPLINGERVGYFKGGRGLRQGDPISPYLFTLVMEVFNLIVRKNIKENENFKYHYGCKKLEITHLCFADDLLVLCHGDCESVSIIKKSLNEFSRQTGCKTVKEIVGMKLSGMKVKESSTVREVKERWNRPRTAYQLPLPAVRDTVQLETAVSTISQEYLLEFTSQYGISEALHLELPGPEDRTVDFPKGNCYTKPLDSLKNWNNRFFWVDERVFPTIMDWRTSALKDGMPTENTYSPEVVRVLDTHRTPIQKQPEALLCLVGLSCKYYLGDEVYPTFLHDDDRSGYLQLSNFLVQDQETAALEVPPLEDVLTMGCAPEAGLAKRVAATDPHVVKERRKRGHDRVDTNAPPKVLRKDHADPRLTESTRGGKSLAAIEVGMVSTCPTPATQSAPADVSDPDPLSFADPRSRPSADVAQSSKGAAAAGDPKSENTSFASMVGSPERIYPPEWGITNDSGDGVAAAVEVRTGSKAAEEICCSGDMKKAVEDKSMTLSQELENMRALFSDLQRCAEMDARLDALSIDFDEELYPHMLTAIADVVSAGIAKSMSEGLKHEVEHVQAQLDLEAIEAYDPKAKAKYITALQALKNLKYPLVDQLEGLKDAPMDVIMASLHLESDTEDDAPQWACKEEMLLADAITANVSRAEKKKKCRVVCGTHGVGSAHHARSDGVPVSVLTIIPQGLAILLADAATQTDTSDEASQLLRSSSLPVMHS